MKDHLETAPVIDAVRSKDGCPICRLRGMIETQTVERYLGGAVMEPDIRLRTNAVGFCRTHHRQLMAQKDYHGYALMMQTRLREVGKQLAPAAAGLPGTTLLEQKRVAALRRQLREAVGGCLVCQNMRETVSRYLDIFMKLYREDGSFRADFDQGPGLCLEDLDLLLGAAGSLPSGLRRELLNAVSTQLKAGFATAQADLDALCSSFHYGSEEKNNPRIHQALERAVDLLRGKTF